VTHLRSDRELAVQQHKQEQKALPALVFGAYGVVRTIEWEISQGLPKPSGGKGGVSTQVTREHLDQVLDHVANGRNIVLWERFVGQMETVAQALEVNLPSHLPSTERMMFTAFVYIKFFSDSPTET
jgi:hypothetical protein